MTDIRKGIRKATIIFLVSILVLYAGYYVSAAYLDRIIGMTLSASTVIGSLIGAAVVKGNGKSYRGYLFVCLSAAFASGLAIGAYFAKFGVDYPESVKVFGGVLGTILLTWLLLQLPWRKSVLFLAIAAMVGAILYSILHFKDSPLFPEVLFLASFLLILDIGLLCFVRFVIDVEECLLYTYLSAFFVVFLVVLIIITEGDAAQGLDGVGGGGSGHPVRRKNEIPPLPE